METLIELSGISKQYKQNGNVINALHGITLSVTAGSFIVITGASGSGKTTLLLTIGGLIRPTAGSLKFRGQPLHSASDKTVADYRRLNLGFVMQNFCLIPYMTAEENVMVSLRTSEKTKQARHNKAKELLDSVGLVDRISHYPSQLSAGQQQRVAIARALANNPTLILADEPTGNLDPELGCEIMNIMKELNTNRGTTILMVTHTPSAVAFGNHHIRLRDGELLETIVK